MRTLRARPLLGEVGFDWVLLDERYQPVQRGTGELPAHQGVGELILPAEQVNLLQAKLPRKGKRSTDMLQWAAEDLCLDAAEQLHVVMLDDASELASLAVMRLDWLDGLRAMLAKTGRSWRVWAEQLILPVPSDGWQLAWDGRRGVLRTADCAGVVLDDNGEQAPLALQLALRDTPTQAVHVYAHQADQALIRRWLNGLSCQFDDVWDWRHGRLDERFDLLGAVRRKRDWWADLAGLRPAMYAVLTMLVLQFGATVVDRIQLGLRAQHLQADMVTLFHQYYPQVSNVVDAPLQMHRLLNEQRHGAGLANDTDFIPMLARVSPLLAQMPSASVQQIGYADGELTLTLRMPNASAASGLLTALQSVFSSVDMQQSGENVVYTIEQAG